MEKSTDSNTLAIHLCGYGFEDPFLLDSKLHFHPFFQMNLVCGGRGYFKTAQGRRELLPGDAVLVPPGVHHALQLEKDCGFCDYSFKFFLRDNSFSNQDRVIFSPDESREQQLIWINALGDIFKSIVPPELIRVPVEFPLAPDTPGVELPQDLRRTKPSGLLGTHQNKTSGTEPQREIRHGSRVRTAPQLFGWPPAVSRPQRDRTYHQRGDRPRARAYRAGAFDLVKCLHLTSGGKDGIQGFDLLRPFFPQIHRGNSGQLPQAQPSESVNFQQTYYCFRHPAQVLRSCGYRLFERHCS